MRKHVSIYRDGCEVEFIGVLSLPSNKKMSGLFCCVDGIMQVCSYRDGWEVGVTPILLLLHDNISFNEVYSGTCEIDSPTPFTLNELFTH